MKYHISDNEGFSLATLKEAKARTVTVFLSADLHDTNTAKTRATELLYTDALISGAGQYNRAQFLDAVNSLGATVTVGISDGVITIFVRCSSDVLKKVMVLVEAIIKLPHFDTKELSRIKQTTINTLKESKEDTKALAHEELRNTIYGQQDRRYTFATETLIDEVKLVTKRDLQKLHIKVRTCPWICSIAGSDDSIKVVEKALTTLKKGIKSKVPELSIHQQRPPQPGITLIDVPSKQNIDFSIGAPVPITLHHPEYLPLVFGLAVLGIGGFQSRLMSTVREAEGLTYGIHARTETFLNEEQGYWRIGTFFAPDKAREGLTSTFREVTKIFEQGISKTEFTLFRANLKTKQVLIGDSTARLLSDLHGYHLQKFSLEEILEHKKRLLTLKLEEVNTAIKHYLNPKLLTICGAGPVKKVKKSLQDFSKTVS